MKKTLTIILTLMLAIAIAVSTSGCSIIAGELGKEEEKRLILSMLNEKYGEEFIVHSIESEGSGGNGVPNFKALFDFTGRYISYKTICSPKSNEEILFEAYEREKGTVLYDDYPHAVIEKKAKDITEEIVSKYTDDFIIYTYVSMPNNDGGIDDDTWNKIINAEPFKSAEEITIENYVDKYYESTRLTLDIIFLNNIANKIEFHQKILDELGYELKKLRVLAQVYYCEEDTMGRCEKHIEKNKHDPRIYIDDILSNNSLCYIYYRRQETDYKWVFNEGSSVTSYE